MKFREMKSPRYEEAHLETFAKKPEALSQSFMSFRSDLRQLKYREIKDSGLFYIDGYESPVIEFSRSGYKPELNLIVSGRLWYQHKYWTKDENGQDIIREKSKELERLYSSLVRWIKKHCTRLPNGNYIGPHAAELHERGAKLS